MSGHCRFVYDYWVRRGRLRDGDMRAWRTFAPALTGPVCLTFSNGPHTQSRGCNIGVQPTKSRFADYIFESILLNNLHQYRFISQTYTYSCSNELFCCKLSGKSIWLPLYSKYLWLFHCLSNRLCYRTKSSNAFRCLNLSIGYIILFEYHMPHCYHIFCVSIPSIHTLCKSFD